MRAWLLPLLDPATNNPVPVRAKRKPNDPLPMRVLTRVGGPTTATTDQGLYSVHDLHADYTAAETAAWATWRRMKLLDPIRGQQAITVGNDTVYVDGLVVAEAPRWEYYSDTVERFVARYRVDLRFVTA